jgi:hypothetical protein
MRLNIARLLLQSIIGATENLRLSESPDLLMVAETFTGTKYA